MKDKKSYLLWDGDCGVCDYAIRKITPYLNQYKIVIIAYQFADETVCPPAIRLECANAIHFRNVDGRYSKAPKALADAMKLSGHTKSSALMTLPIILQIMNVGYYIIARNRKYISRVFGLNACRIP